VYLGKASADTTNPEMSTKETKRKKTLQEKFCPCQNQNQTQQEMIGLTIKNQFACHTPAKYK
jgi:hypothetical protein